MTSNTTLKLITFDLEGGSVNRCFKTPVIIANAGCRKRLSRKLGYGKIAALFLNIPTSRGDRPASPPGFSASRFSRNFSDLETPIYRAPLYPLLMCHYSTSYQVFRALVQRCTAQAWYNISTVLIYNIFVLRRIMLGSRKPLYNTVAIAVQHLKIILSCTAWRMF